MVRVRGSGLGLTAAPVVALISSGAAARSDDPGPEGDLIEVIGVEYAFDGMPATVPAGTALTLRNDGVEFHELEVAKVREDATESAEELLAMGEAAISSGMVELVEFAPISALPGEASENATLLAEPGRYVLACFIPQGFIPEALEELGVTDVLDYNDPASWPPGAQAILNNPAHVALGMFQEFTVAADDTAEDVAAEVEDEETGTDG